MKDIVRYLNLGPWPIFVGFTTSEKAFAKELKRLKVDEDCHFIARARANATTHYFESAGKWVVIITMQPMTKGITREQYAALLAHEAMHVVQQIRRELNNDSHLGDEAEAYLMQQIVQDCLQVAWDSSKVRAVHP